MQKSDRLKRRKHCSGEAASRDSPHINTDAQPNDLGREVFSWGAAMDDDQVLQFFPAGPIVGAEKARRAGRKTDVFATVWIRLGINACMDERDTALLVYSVMRQRLSNRNVVLVEAGPPVPPVPAVHVQPLRVRAPGEGDVSAVAAPVLARGDACRRLDGVWRHLRAIAARGSNEQDL